jgi:hypothetical protein
MARRVRFLDRDALLEYHEGAVMDMIDCCASDIWYEQSELAQMKRKAVIVSKEAHKCGLGTLLANTYGSTGPEVQRALEKWTIHGSSRRGLERWISDEYAAKRSDIRRRTIQSILRAQAKMVSEGMTDSNYSMKVLSRLSEAFSKDSLSFARFMGLADEYATRNDAENEDDDVGIGTSKGFNKQPFHHQNRIILAKHKLGLGATGTHVNSTVDMRHFY